MKEQSQPPAEAVPKFSSFRPPPQSPRTSTANTKQSHLSDSFSAKPNGHVKNSPTTKPPLKDPKTEAYYVRRRHSGSPHSKRRKQYHASAFLSTGTPSKSDQQNFIADWVGDDANSKYGSPHPRTVPAYQRFESREVLGLVFNKVAIASSDGKSVVLTTKGLEGRGSSDKNALSRLAKDNKKDLNEVLVCRNATSDSATDLNLDYVPFIPDQSMKDHSEDYTSHEISSSSNEHLDASALRPNRHAKTDANGSNDPRNSSNIKEFEASFFVDTSLGHRRRDIEKAVEANPTSLDTWIDLIRFQSELTGNGNLLHGDEPSRAERHSNADIKLTIFEKAIKSVQTLKDKEVLLQGMMRAGATIWEANKLAMKWQNVLRQYPKSIQLKIDYLNYIETASSLVSVEEICKVYYGCLDLLDECRTSNGADESDLYVKQVYVTLRMTLFLRKAGFSEHAVAIWQALLEYEFYMPANLEVSRCKMPKDSKLDLRSAFEEFWDSELPRIGEPDAQGWSHFQADQDVSVDSRKDIVPTFLGSLNQFEAWVQTERSHSLNSHYPARTVDDVNKNDPYRVILFPDIKNFLIRSPTETGRWVLVDALFCFCHMPPYLSRTFDNGPSLWFGNPFTRNEILYGDQRSILRWPEGKCRNGETDDDLKQRSSCSPFTLPVQDYLLTTDTLFTTKENWFSAFNSWNTKTQGGVEPVNGFWIYRVMAMLLHTAKLGELFVEYYLAFELEISPEVARKTAKALLKTQPSNVRLYNAYALVEYRLGNVGTADRVVQKAWDMRNKLDKNEVCNMISLCRTRTWQRLESLQSSDALQGIVEFSIGPVEDAAPSTLTSEYGAHDHGSTTTILKAQTNLTAIMNEMLSLKLPFHAIECVECLILLAYLGNSHSIALATDTFKKNLLVLATRFPSDSSIEELIRQSFARILYWHATHQKLFSPAALRAFLTESIESFPRNSMFLSLHAWNETRFRIDDRARSIISDIILRSARRAPTGNAESIVTHVFAIWANIARETSFGSNRQAVRETFERAFRSDCGAKCSGLWKIYFLFEYSRGETRKAKDVFYRGVMACPWVKEIYWLAFEYLRTEMTDLELRNVYDMMVDRGIRIHVALEDVAVKT